MVQESQQESGLSAEEIIRFAGSWGFKVSKRQLSRWQNQGLIPRPQQTHSKGAAGSRSIYPRHAGDQVCFLCKIAQQFRDQSKVGWYLWRLGLPVDDKHWKPVFAEAIEYLDKFLKPNLEPSEDEGLSLDEEPKYVLSDRLYLAVQKGAQQKISHPKAGPLKRLLGTERFETLVARSLEIMVGNFSRDPPIAEQNDPDKDISLSNLLNVSFAQDARHTELIIKVFEYLSDKAKTGTLVDQLRTVAPDQLQSLSREIANVEGLVPALMGNKDLIPQINGVPAFSLKSGIRDQAILILGWCVARQMAANAENLKRLYGKNEILPP